MSRVLEHLKTIPWAIQRESLRTIFEIAARENRSVEVIEREMGERLDNTRRVRIRNGVAVVPVTGPIFRRANLFTALSGATSTEVLATEIGAALADPEVRALVLDIDSPGGEAWGTHELAELIFVARTEKPIVAFISGLGASAAYMIASAAQRIVIERLAVAGSIGTVIQVSDFSEAKEKAGVRTKDIVSRQSPRKRVDPFTDEGEAQIQELVDKLAEVIVESVARNRDVTPETVMSDFGRGGLLVGQEAVDAGMADSTGTLEALISELGESQPSGQALIAHSTGTAAGDHSNMEVSMKDEATKVPAAELKPTPATVDRTYLDAKHADLVASIRAEGKAEGMTEGATQERERILGIAGIEAQGFEDLKAELMADPECTAGDAALRILGAQKERKEARGQAHIDSLAAAEDDLDAPTPAMEGGGSEVVDEVAAIMNAGQVPAGQEV